MKYALSPLRLNAIVLVILLLPVIATAAEPALQEKSKQEAADDVTLSGIVVDEQDKPVPGVTVFIEWRYPEQERVETKTDEHGRFLLRPSKENVRGQMIQAITDSGQKLAQARISRRNVDQDHAQHDLRLQLQPARRVELYVVDATGKPIANAKTGIIGDFRDWGTNTTDEKGRVVYHVPHDVKID
ncbi:carboxypeptidase-like regulatory domain-containing protein [uncultured Gimesia sp.]|jgi:uncharacterized GH25 family protein|uniref:carboxypeptidase-like regulatory domain-containing protein n=1 Tax=uncultured Gimesia sp. TaxID=1678688 RepID=UPI0026256223|nr:carboxypeptidase-like regulatory domain-containing protein [uncultured Gimesia sp.]